MRIPTKLLVFVVILQVFILIAQIMIITHNSTESPITVTRKPEVDFDILVESRFLRAYLDGRVQQ